MGREHRYIYKSVPYLSYGSVKTCYNFRYLTVLFVEKDRA